MRSRRFSSPFAPAPMPITTIRPFVATALRFAPRFGAPTSSRMTSNGPCSSKPSGSSTSCAPSAVTDSRASARRTVAVTCAPALAPSCTAAVPTPPAAPAPRPRGGGPPPPPGPGPGRAPPLRGRGRGKARVGGGGKARGPPPRLAPVDPRGDRHRLSLVARRELGLPAAADDRHDAVARGEAVRPGAARDDLAGELEAGDVLGRARRRRVDAAPLHHVRPVDAGGLDADEDLAGPRLGVGVVLDGQLLVADRDGAHGAGVKHLGRAGGARSPPPP